jgi:hypothetical protein
VLVATYGLAGLGLLCVAVASILGIGPLST